MLVKHFAALLLSAASLLADPREALAQAIDALQSKGSYTWTNRLAGRLPVAGPHNGKVEGNTISLHIRFEDADLDAALKGGIRIVKTGNEWKSAETIPAPKFAGATVLEPAVRAAALVRSLKPPAQEARELLNKLPAIESGPDGSFQAPLPAELISGLLIPIGLHLGERPIQNARGRATFRVRDGVLHHYAVEYSGLIKGPFGEFDLVRTNTTEMFAIGATKVEFPADVLKLLEAPK